MAKKYIKLERPIKELLAEELRALLSGSQISVLMRTIILNERDFLSVNYKRSLRGFWYSTVKPTLDKLGYSQKRIKRRINYLNGTVNYLGIWQS